MTIEQRAKQVWDFFIQQGWTGQAIAGMLGSMELESGINPDLHEYSGGGLWFSSMDTWICTDELGPTTRLGLSPNDHSTPTNSV
ncbi:phage tail tip lysozyme [Ignavigranum ruoffiae]